MIRALNLVKQPAFPVMASVLVAIAGLAVRSCHAASGSFLIPVCGGEPMVMAFGNSSTVHCAGCYVAAAGFIAAFLSVFSIAKQRNL